MKDSRLTLWTNPTTHATGSTTNTGPTLDLRQGYTLQGGSPGSTQLYGIGVEILQTQATGTGQTTAWEWEVSSDNSTWYKGGYIGTTTMDADDQSTEQLKGNLVTKYRYVRLYATNTGVGTSTSKVFSEDWGSFAGNSVANA